MRQNTSKKKEKNRLGGMLIEQILELRGPGLPGRTCTPITSYFHDKTIIFMEYIRVDYYFC